MTYSLSFKRSVLFLLLAGGLFSCSKNHFLDKKPNSDIITPSTLSDFQALLDNTGVMNVTPALGELSADNFYLDYSFWLPLDAKEHNAYIWAPDIYNGQGSVDDWNYPYQQVFYANVVLDGLSKMTPDSSNQQNWNALKGAALFMRAYAFYNVAQVFATVYDSVTAGTDLGIPLRLTPDINAVSKRATVKETYDQIEQDLHDAYNLLPASPPSANRNRPSQPAVLAMLARMYLSMRDYKQAGNCADSCLQLYSTLMDYNSYSTSSVVPFTRLNEETIYQSVFFSQPSSQVLRAIIYPSVIVDSMLYASYASNDLRSQLFYKINSSGYPNMNGSYGGSIYPFSGLATDEVYLIRAECEARAGNTGNALTDLNTLLKKRWMTGTYTPFTAGTAVEVLDTILLERRKELAFRGVRWTDLRRLNKEGWNIELTRKLNGQTYLLDSNSLLYVLPIPPDVIAFSGMTQNPRPQP